LGIILYLIGISLLLGLCGLGLFLWSRRQGQFDDLEGAARRVLFEDLETTPAPPAPPSPQPGGSGN
jgi:cbb3-type cytochrome oxidase maturation protein